MRLRRRFGYVLLGLAALVLVVLAGAAAVIARFNPNTLKPRIEAAVEQATGRKLVLTGPVTLTWSLWPTVALHDVALTNPPGFSRPQMATLQRLDVQLALLPLLRDRVDIARLVLVRPDILLEQNGEGEANWQFAAAHAATALVPAPAAPTPAAPAPATPAPATPPPAAAPQPKRTGDRVSLTDLRIEDGTLTWRDDRSGRTMTLAVQTLTAHAASPQAPTQLALQATCNGLPFTLKGEVGPLSRLQQPRATTPWPVSLRLAAAGASIAADGSFTQPLRGRGYALTVDATVPDLAALAPLLPGRHVPPLHDVRLTARIADSGGPVPHVDSASLHLGPADLGRYVGGLLLEAVDIDVPPHQQPVHIEAQASLDRTPVSFVATLGGSAALLAERPPGSGAGAGPVPVPVPVPVDMTLRADNASLTVKGSVTHPETLSGANLALAATIPDLPALAPVLHRNLPPLTKVAFQAQLSDAPGGFRHGAALHGIRLTAAQGDLSGDLSVRTGSPPAVTGTLHANRIDADALLAAARQPTVHPPSAGPPPARATAAPPPAPPPSPPRVAAAPPPRQAGRLFPDTPLPFGLLRRANADLALTVGDLRSGGQDYHAIDLHLVLQDGKLRLAPLTAALPEGKLVGTLTIDAAAAAPPIALTLRAPGLAVAPLLADAGLPPYASGKLEVYADLHSAGASPHAIAAGLDGSLGLAMQNGTIDAALLNNLLGPVLARANLLGALAHGGSSDLRCFALRANATNGVADLRTLLLNSGLLTMDGSGSVNLGKETLALTLRPQGRIAGTGIVMTTNVTGPIRSPEVKVNGISTLAENAGAVAGGAIGAATPLGVIAGLLGGGRLAGDAPNDTCAGPLALARGQPAPAAASAHAPAKKKENAGQLLRQLFR